MRFGRRREGLRRRVESVRLKAGMLVFRGMVGWVGFWY